MRSWIQRSLWDVVPRDQRDTPEAFRRRQVVAAIVVLVGAGVLGWSLRLEPGGNLFYVAAVVLAGVWAVGAFLPAGSTSAASPARARCSSGRSSRRSCSACSWSGSSSSARSSCARSTRWPTTSAACWSTPTRARWPLLAAITFVNGIAEELFFRGAMYAAIPRHPVLWTTIAYVVATLATGNVMLAFAAVLLGAVCGLERRASGGILAPILTHITWSLSMLFLLPLLF